MGWRTWVYLRVTEVSPRTRKFYRIICNYETGGDKTGGAHHHRSDTGGATQWGISSAAHPEWRDVIKAGELEYEIAEAIVQNEYSERILGFERIPEPLAFLLLDSYFHGSPSPVVAEIQKALNFVDDAGLVVDGDWGPITYRAARRASEAAIFAAIYSLATSAGDIALSIANATMIRQKVLGLPQYDYHDGFTRRLEWRARQSANLLS